jgi:4-hydroxy-tetrahydrodipicolinate synthase
MQWLFCEPNPIGINTALMMTDAVSPNFRLPYKALTTAQRQQGFELLAALNSDDIVGDTLSLLDDSDFKYCV